MCTYILCEVRFQGYRFYRLKKKKSYMCKCRQNNANLFYSMAASPIYHYISYPRFINFQYWWISCCKLQFTPNCTEVGGGIELQITCLVSGSYFGHSTACLTMPFKLHHGSWQWQAPFWKKIYIYTFDNYGHNLPKQESVLFLKVIVN